MSSWAAAAWGGAAMRGPLARPLCSTSFFLFLAASCLLADTRYPSDRWLVLWNVVASRLRRLAAS